jgi:enoyl-[acyl-carrier-protein] reductase (NADH)
VIDALKARLEDANRLLALAEADLEAGMRAITVSNGGEKTIVAAVLTEAFAKLRAARQDVAEIERLLAVETDHDPP